MTTIDKSNFIQAFKNVFSNIDAEHFDMNQNRADFENWDSLTHMQLVSEIETAYGITFEMDEIVDINTPQDLMTLVEKKKSTS